MEGSIRKVGHGKLLSADEGVADAGADTSIITGSLVTVCKRPTCDDA